MTQKNLLIPLAILLLMALLIYTHYNQFQKSSPDPTATDTKNLPSPQSPHPPVSPENQPPSTKNTRTPNSPPPSNDPRFTRHPDGSISLTQSLERAKLLHQKNTPPQSDLEILNQLLADYRLIYKENPVGTDNFEFTLALTGTNPKKIIFIPKNHKAIRNNADGHLELLDRWGSPYHFHPLRSDHMDILSPGPDQKLWTKDDLSLAPSKEK